MTNKDTPEHIDYGNLMHDALRVLIRRVMLQIERHGLPGDHHFFITLNTQHPELDMADWLRDRYPAEITVVIQNWFDNLEVGDTGFAITLNFGDAPEPLFIPWDAIITFVDPSVEFGLRFEGQEDDRPEGPHVVEDEIAPQEGQEIATSNDTSAEAPMHEDAPEAPAREAEIVSLDNFRK